MEFSDLPQSAQHRIAAVEIEADSIVASASASAKQIVETYQFGLDPLGIDRVIYGDSLAVRAARNELVNGREWAAGNLLGAIAGEYLKAGKLDMERFNAKLDTIGDWIFQKYRIDRAVLDQMKQECRKAALLKRAAALDADEASKRTIIARLPAEARVRTEAETAAQFSNRASWLKERLRERSWSKHDLARHGGPDHKTTQKILDGLPVREDVLQTVADGLSKGKVNGANIAVSVLDIPQA